MTSLASSLDHGVRRAFSRRLSDKSLISQGVAMPARAGSCPQTQLVINNSRRIRRRFKPAPLTFATRLAIRELWPDISVLVGVNAGVRNKRIRKKVLAYQRANELPEREPSSRLIRTVLAETIQETIEEEGT